MVKLGAGPRPSGGGMHAVAATSAATTATKRTYLRITTLLTLGVVPDENRSVVWYP